MSTPQSPTPQPTMTQNVVGTAQTLPRWAFVAIVGGAALVTWWLISEYKSSEPKETSWTDRATALLTSRGYTNNQITDALNHYYRGGMTVQEQDMIAQVIRAIGTPDMPETSITEVPPPSPVTPSGRPEDTPTPIPDNNGTAYWYVTSMGFGWTSSFRGIAQQLYGDPNKGYLLQQVNPGLATSDYGKLPIGTIVKIPRGSYA